MKVRPAMIAVHTAGTPRPVWPCLFPLQLTCLPGFFWIFASVIVSALVTVPIDGCPNLHCPANGRSPIELALEQAAGWVE